MPTPSLIVGLRLGGKKAAVFGDGPIAASRAVFALDAGADVVLYTGSVPESLSKWTDSGRVTAVPAAKYAASDISQFSVVFVAANAYGAQDIARDAHAAGVPVNVAGDGELSDFALMPTYRGASGLQIAVTTNGVAPRAASRLLREIVDKLPSDLEPQLVQVEQLAQVARTAELERAKVLASMDTSQSDNEVSQSATAADTPALRSTPSSVAEGPEFLDLATLRTSATQVTQDTDVATASAYVAHALSDLCFVYAAREQTLGAAALAWTRRAEKNAYGEWVSALRMETRLGAGHAAWGALAGGSRVAAIASAESLPYMAPVLVQLAARRQPIVVHAAAQSLDDASCVRSDVAGVFAALHSRAVVLASASAQEAHDVAAVAHAVAAAAQVPVVHVTSGALDADDTNSVHVLSHSQLAAFVADVAVTQLEPAEAVQRALSQFHAVSGRTYRSLEYSGSSDAETVFVALGAAAASAQAALPSIMQESHAGVLNVRALRPWDHAELVRSLPASVRHVVVLSATDGADALLADVSVAALISGAAHIGVCGESVLDASDADIANTMRTALGLDTVSEETETEAEVEAEAKAEAKVEETPAIATPDASLDTALALAKRLAFPEAYATQLTARPDERTFAVKVSSLRRMTPDSYDRNIIHIEFDTRNTGLTYEIGDALGVYGSNDAQEVRDFCAAYGVDEDVLVTAVKDGRSQTRTVYAWLAHTLDMFGRPSKKFYSALAAFATDAAEAEKLEWLTTPEGAIEFKGRVADTVTYADILLEFASARPPITHLVDLIAPIKPRHYSIASSARMHPGSVHLCVVTVHWPTSRGPRAGQCTRFLDALNIGDAVTVSVKPSVMKLPPLDAQPVIMAGLGTGMAPFRAFIEERAMRKLEGIDVGPMTLYFGSRHRAMEYLYGEEFEAYHADGLLTNLRLAFSRDQKDKVYIQHKMRDDAELLADGLLANEGCFYLCGPTWPASDVKDAMVHAFTSHGGVKPTEASKVIEELKESDRYILEVY
ncbi:sulfite reductase [NADPH] flavoprotein component [Coemansia sp. RSA 1822]|nr:sulfite reductase [NADPH] flavoprotein component [Coemansia sp. RSA 638]KAJ2558232.1 sulfite reductase [NADPH] flavoprotein component [Coemansia sp. RSA 1822]